MKKFYVHKLTLVGNIKEQFLTPFNRSHLTYKIQNKGIKKLQLPSILMIQIHKHHFS